MNGQVVTGLGAAAAAALLSACASRPAPEAAPRPAPVVVRPPSIVVDQLPPPPSGAVDWPDMLPTSGDWSYSGHAGGSEARFGAEGGEQLSLRCDQARRQIFVTRQGMNGSVRLRTTYGARTLPLGAALEAADPLFDEIAFSRGRFAVDSEGLAQLVLPAWPEPARVIEDCRG